jgi:hypothetical protein
MKAESILQGLVLVLCLVPLVGCKREQQGIDDPRAREQLKGLGNSHIELGQDRVLVLRERATTLALGDSQTRLTTLLGPFDREELIGPKKGEAWKCRGLLYYVAMVEEEPGNANDVKVEFIFERKGDKLVAVLSNVEGIASRGDMAQCR